MLQSVLDERRLPSLLPSLLLQADGSYVQDVGAWDRQRAVWRRLLLEHEYGLLPPVVQPAVTQTTNAINFAGKAEWQTLQFTFTYHEKSHTVPVQMIYPRGARGIPFFLMLNFRPDIPDRYLPVEELIDHGFGILTFCYQDVTSDSADFTSGLAGLFLEGERQATTFGKIALWAYMAMRGMDYLQTREEADPHRIAV